MSWIDFILNVAGLLLWLNWRAVRPAVMTPGAAAPRRLDPPAGRGWYLAGLAALLCGRAVFYWQAGERLGWVADLRLGVTSLLFRSDLPGRMLLYSWLSFAATLIVFYLCLIFFSVANAAAKEDDSWLRLVRLHLGRLEGWPALVKLLLPLVSMIALWCALHPLLLWIGLTPEAAAGSLVEQGTMIGLSVYLALRFLILGFLVVDVVNSYVYLGDFALLKFVNTTSRGMLRPLRRLPLRMGRVDLAPLAGMALLVLPGLIGQTRLAGVLQFPVGPHLF